MPLPQKFARGDEMGRGPYEKSGIINDTGLHPGKTTKEMFEIPFYTEDVENEDGRIVERKLMDNEMTINVKLWYLPYGNKKSDPFIWQDVTKKVAVSE